MCAHMYMRSHGSKRVMSNVLLISANTSTSNLGRMVILEPEYCRRATNVLLVSVLTAGDHQARVNLSLYRLEAVCRKVVMLWQYYKPQVTADLLMAGERNSAFYWSVWGLISLFSSLLLYAGLMVVIQERTVIQLLIYVTLIAWRTV